VTWIHTSASGRHYIAKAPPTSRIEPLTRVETLLQLKQDSAGASPSRSMSTYCRVSPAAVCSCWEIDADAKNHAGRPNRAAGPTCK
jgi:hypothetical protein